MISLYYISYLFYLAESFDKYECPHCPTHMCIPKSEPYKCRRYPAPAQYDCKTFNIDNECKPGYYCHIDFVCKAPAANDEYCTLHEECQSGYCVGTCRKKKEKKQNGEECDFSYECESDLCSLIFPFGKCERKQKQGELCTFNFQCYNKQCNWGTCD